MATKKRGRPPKGGESEPDEENLTESRPRKRIRADEAGELEHGRLETRGSKSSRPGKASARAHQQAANSEGRGAAGAASRRKRRDRQSDDRPAEAPSRGSQSKAQAGKSQTTLPPEQPATEGQGEEETSVRRSRRERRSTDENPWWAAKEVPQEAAARAGKEQAGASKKSKRGRPVPAEVAVSKAQDRPGSSHTDKQAKGKRRGRPSLASNEADTSKQDTQPPSGGTHKGPKKKTRRHSSEAEPARRRRSANNEPIASPNPDADQAAAAPGPKATLPRYRHLASRTRQIPRATIAAKWQPLDGPSIAAVDAILADATRPVLHRLRDRDQRHAQARTILRTFAARLRAKLVKGIPFPPPTDGASTTTTATTVKGKGRGKGRKAQAKVGSSSHEAELDFERTVDAIRGLERALDPLLHSVALLEREKEREEAALEREYKVLRTLEANARAQAREWRERGKRDHVLALPLAGGSGSREDGGGEERGLEVVKGEREGGVDGVFKDLQEQELLALSQQIGSHMESMRSNLGQIEGVLPAIAKSRAALQGVLCQYLDPEQYDQVVLG
ncbi:hypothetical protein VTK56DRAFT_8765 [Thermocarpiscus australiensis]